MGLSISKLQAGETYTVEFKDKLCPNIRYKCKAVYLGIYHTEFIEAHHCFAILRETSQFLKIKHLLFCVYEDDEFENYDIVDEEYIEIARKYFNSKQYDLFWIVEEQIIKIETDFTNLINQIKGELM
jgi:hypothetical protein